MTKTPRAKKTGAELDRFLAEMRDRFKLIEENEQSIRSDAADDHKFRAGRDNDQWDPLIIEGRKKRPTFTINRAQQIVRHLTNEQRQQRPAVEISPIGEGADVETAQVLQGYERHIELVSDADIAHDTAFDSMATGGFGYFRIVPEFVHPKSLNQEPRYQRILNPFSVYCGPCKKPDYSDMPYCFVTEDVPKEEYKNKYKDSDLAGLTSFSAVGDQAPGWVKGDTVRVAEYFYVENETKTLVKGTDGATYFADELPKGVKAVPGEAYTRETEIPTVYWCKTNGIELIEDEIEVACDEIPIIPVLGEEFVVDEKRILAGAVRYIRVPGQMYNLWTSAMAETIALAPKAPWLATPAQIAGFERYWNTANNENWSVLPYNPDPKTGEKPSRQFAEPPIQAIAEALAHADMDVKGLSSFDPALALHGPEQSGKALLLRRQNSDQANFGFQDNMARAVRRGGRVVLSFMQRLSDTARVVRIVNPDGTKDQVQIGAQTTYKGAQKLFDLTVGIYDLAVSTGPSYQSKRKEASESIMSLVQSFPPLMQFCGDLLVRDMDWPQSQEIADRLKKMLPAQLQDPPDGSQPIPPQVQQQMAQLSQQNDQLTQAIHRISAALETKQIESASRERIALINAKAGIMEAALKAKSAEALAVFQADQDHIDRQLALLPDPALGQEAGPPNGNAPQQPQQGAPALPQTPAFPRPAAGNPSPAQPSQA